MVKMLILKMIKQKKVVLAMMMMKMVALNQAKTKKIMMNCQMKKRQAKKIQKKKWYSTLKIKKKQSVNKIKMISTLTTTTVQMECLEISHNHLKRKAIGIHCNLKF